MTDATARMAELEDKQRELDEQKKEMAHLMITQRELQEVDLSLTKLRGEEFTLRKAAEDPRECEIRKQEMLLEAAHLNEKVKELEAIRLTLESRFASAEQGERNIKFNKYRMFSNIRELLKNSGVKIGQIEKEAGCQLGYMSRLDKPNSTSEPSVEFLITAAKMLGVSLDVLLFVELAELNSTEKYLLSFLEKLQKDTVDEKLEWKKETADSLNRLELDMNGYTGHPLFSFESFMEEGETEYPDQVERITFISNSFECHTYINGDCYNLRMKNGSVLYLMDISKSVYRKGDPDAFAKEVWMYTPGVGCSFIVSNRNVPQLAVLVDLLFSTVRDFMKHPQINKEVRFVIDAFLEGDLGTDDMDELPFY